MKRALRGFFLILTLPLLAIALYFGIAFLMVFFPANATRDDEQGRTRGEEKINVYALSNGMHVDFVVPVKSHLFDWTSIFPTADVGLPPAQAKYLAIGWGDREFYLNTQQISDLTATRAVGALLGQHGVLVHVEYLDSINYGQYIYKVPLSATQYAALIRYIRQSLALSDAGKAQVIKNRHYGPRDAFYEARGSYSMFNTCNNWAGLGFQEAGVKVSRWTPLVPLVLWHFEKPNP